MLCIISLLPSFMPDHSFQKTMMMMIRGNKRSCLFMPFHVLLFLILLLLLHGPPAASSVETTKTAAAASSCSNGTQAGNCVSMANHRIEDEDEGAPGQQFLDNLRQVAHFTDRTIKPPPVCNSKIYGNCIVPINSQHRPCDYYNRCNRGGQ